MSVKSIVYTIIDAAGIKGNDVTVTTFDPAVIAAIVEECDPSEDNYVVSLGIRLVSVEFTE